VLLWGLCIVATMCGQRLRPGRFLVQHRVLTGPASDVALWVQRCHVRASAGCGVRSAPRVSACSVSRSAGRRLGWRAEPLIEFLAGLRATNRQLSGLGELAGDQTNLPRSMTAARMSGSAIGTSPSSLA